MVKNPPRLNLEPMGDDPIADPPNAVSAWNIANALTVFRLVLVPVFLVALFWGTGHETSWRVIAWAVFAVASVTDRFDGELARRRNLITEFGKLADPIADKALVGAALIGLSLLGDLPWWVTVVDPGARGRRDGAAVLGDPARRDRGQPRRQAEDAAARRRDRPVRAARVGLAARHRLGRDDRGDRRRAGRPASTTSDGRCSCGARRTRRCSTWNRHACSDVRDTTDCDVRSERTGFIRRHAGPAAAGTVN